VAALKIPVEKLRLMYANMATTRAFEETAMRLFSLGKVHGTAHFCIGEEATAAGVCAAIEPQDLIYATHRGHGQSISKGMNVDTMMAEFLGRATGVCKGKGGCMHIADVAAGNLGANGIVGGGIPIAVGAALSTAMQRIERVVVCFFGDGASNEGTFHEALNLASVWKLPVLFVCINNQYGMSMHVRRSTNLEDLVVRASAYGMPGRSVDGNDAVAVYEATREARAAVLAGPYLLVLNTYRIMGHSKSDAGLYRSREEVEVWKARDPILRLAALLREKGVCTPEEIAAMDAAAVSTVEKALAFAESSPEPSLDAVEDDVYA
jgi:acetoin:2,6-dichlorophenolindophenol oxidoreductase subunit alpha